VAVLASMSLKYSVDIVGTTGLFGIIFLIVFSIMFWIVGSTHYDKIQKVKVIHSKTTKQSITQDTVIVSPQTEIDVFESKFNWLE